MSTRSYDRMLAPTDTSFFLFGARGTGKTTWASRLYRDAHRIDLLDEGRYQDLLADPSSFAAELRAVRPDSWVVVDEVQRIPWLLNEVHRFIEDRRLRFVLLGSSARKLKTAGTNLLAGRALHRQMFPFVPAELAGDFELEQVLTHGSIPVVWTSPDRRAALEAYVQLYVREEVRGEALVRNLPAFARFLPVAALFHGQVVNVAGIARDAGVARSTAAGYLDILDDTLLAIRLPAFEAKLRVQERKHPKLYWLDPGLVRAIKRQLGPLTAEERGPLLEGWVLTVLRAHAQTTHLYDEIRYWAPGHGQTEVDFLLRRNHEMLALEVKAGRRMTSDRMLGLRAIADLPNLVRRIVLYTGSRVLVTSEGIEVWPVEHFLSQLDEGRLWP